MKRVFALSAQVAILCLGIAFSGAASAQNAEELNSRPGLKAIGYHSRLGATDPRRRVLHGCDQLKRQRGELL
jgi:hypothetical protein